MVARRRVEDIRGGGRSWAGGIVEGGWLVGSCRGGDANVAFLLVEKGVAEKPEMSPKEWQSQNTTATATLCAAVDAQNLIVATPRGGFLRSPLLFISIADSVMAHCRHIFPRIGVRLDATTPP